MSLQTDKQTDIRGSLGDTTQNKNKKINPLYGIYVSILNEKYIKTDANRDFSNTLIFS